MNLEPAHTEVRQSPREAHGGGGDDGCMGLLGEFLLVVVTYLCQWGWRGRQGGFHILRYIISFNGGILYNFYFLFCVFFFF